MSENKTALKPCPFCGGAARLQIIKKGFQSLVYCTYCGFGRYGFNNGETDENEAVRLTTAWNRRAREMIGHKCDGCRYKGEHVEMGFKPFGVCYKETNLIKAEKNYNAETCPYDQKIFITNAGLDMKTPYDKKIAEAARELSGEEKHAYLPQLFKIEGVDLAEPGPWPKENPYLKPLPEIDETDDIINLFGQASEIERQTRKAAEGLAALAEAVKTLRPIIETLAETLQPIIKAIGDVMEQIINLYPNKRVIYLATHGKGRTKKKNINRILKWYKEQNKTPSKKRRSRGYIYYTERDGRKYAVCVYS